MQWCSSAFALALALGCSDGDGTQSPDAPTDSLPAGDACPLQAAIETPAGEAMQDGERVDLITGFQGFLFVRVATAAATGAGTLGGTFQITVEGQSAYEQAFQDLALGAPNADGLRPTPEVLIYFNQFPVETVSGRHCQLVLRASDGRCAGTARVDIVLSTDRQCYFGADGGTWCVADAGTGP